MTKKKQKTSKQKAAHAKRAKRLMQDVTMWSWESSKELEGARTCTAIAKVMGFERNLDQSSVDLIVRQRLNWVIVCRAVCELNGEVWVESEAVSAKDFMINDLAEHYERMREEVLKCVQKRHVVDVGWLCRTFNKNSPIDDNTELKYLGVVDTYRKAAWQKLLEEERSGEVERV